MIGFELLEWELQGDGLRARARAPEQSPYFRGHFPRHPILPAVAQLALVSELARELHGEPVGVAGLRGARFRRTLGPGAVLEIVLGPRADPRGQRFEIGSAGEIAATGTLVLLRPAAPEWNTSPGACALTQSEPPREGRRVPIPEDLELDSLPQRDDARLVRQSLGDIAGSFMCMAAVPRDSPFRFVKDGMSLIPTILALEMGAQAAALRQGLALARAGGALGPASGYIVGVRLAYFGSAHLDAGEELLVAIEPEGEAPPLRTYTMRVAAGRGQCARATLSIWS